jgi:FkbM family methyltransferase
VDGEVPLKAFVSRALARAGYRIESTRYVPRQLLDPRGLRRLEFDDVVCRWMHDHGAPLTFVQIGAFDGVTADPLEKYIGRHGWRGVLVEPQPAAAARLRDRYHDNDRVVVIEAAVDRQRGRRTLFVVEPARLPAWAAGMASFDRAHIEKHEPLVPGVTSMIREIAVDCITFDDVLDRLTGTAIDLLQIDAEGADARLLAAFPFERMTPPIVHWEIKNLTMVERETSLARLERFGYRFASSGTEDMMALRGGA